MLGIFRPPKAPGLTDGGGIGRALILLGSLLIGLGAFAFAYLALTRTFGISIVHLDFWWGELWLR